MDECVGLESGVVGGGDGVTVAKLRYQTPTGFPICEFEAWRTFEDRFDNAAWKLSQQVSRSNAMPDWDIIKEAIELHEEPDDGDDYMEQSTVNSVGEELGDK
jgi:hypothetical protein